MIDIKEEDYLEIKKELKRLRKEKDFSRAHRLAMGTLNLGIAHEIRNPLAVINSELEILKFQPRDKEYLSKFSEKILKYTDRIEGIVQKITDLARTEKRSAEVPVDFTQIIEMALSHAKLNSAIKIIKELSPLPKTQGIMEELEKVIFHLIDNCGHAMPEGGTLTIKASLSNGKIEIKIIDTGIGIPEENLERIFDPFFSSRHVAAGLGLSIVYKIVKEHGGDIHVSSEVGRGTTFTLLFNLEKGKK